MLNMRDRYNREKIISALAQFLCIIAGIEPIDSMDGSPNWWMFNDDATKIVDDIHKRFPPIGD